MHHTISDSSIQPTQRTSKSAPKFLPDRRVRTKTCANPYALVHGQDPQVDHQNILQVARDIPLSPQIRTTTHTSSVPKSLKTQSNKITSKGELNPLQESRGGEAT